ncbi:putative RNA recognition motif domain, nucleotide-binding alpha-beta plait domain superfamily [Helianthus anomalus]
MSRMKREGEGKSQSEPVEIRREKEWSEVKSKWQKQQERKERASRNKSTEPKTTFLVANLIDNVSTKGLWDEFLVFGFVLDVYIARKMDVHTNIFAFVPFIRVEDPQAMLLVMKGLAIDKCRVVVLLARYKKGGLVLNNPQTQANHESIKAKSGFPDAKKGNPNGGSFAWWPKGDILYTKVVIRSKHAYQSTGVVELSISDVPCKLQPIPCSLLVTIVDVYPLNNIEKVFGEEVVWKEEAPRCWIREDDHDWVLSFVKNDKELKKKIIVEGLESLSTEGQPSMANMNVDIHVDADFGQSHALGQNQIILESNKLGGVFEASINGKKYSPLTSETVRAEINASLNGENHYPL